MNHLVRITARRLLPAILLASGVGRASAELRLYEPFGYSAGQGLAGVAGQNGVQGAMPPAGTPHGLTAPNGNTWMSTAFGSLVPYDQTNDAMTGAADLTYAALEHPTATGSVSFGGGGTSPRLAFTPINCSVDGSPVDAYYSFLFQITSLADTSPNGGLISGFNNTRGSQSGNPSTVGAALYAKASGSGFVLGILEQGTDATQATYSTTELSFNTTHLVVAKYTINGTLNLGGSTPTTDDTAQIWINPTALGGAEPAGALVAVNERTDIPTNQTDGFATVQTFLLRQAGTTTTGTNSPTNIIFDELRIGTTFAEVTPTSAIAPTGDFDNDGDADGDDFLLWQGGFGLTGTADRIDGDADNDDDVDDVDFGVWKSEFGMTGLASAAGSAIPEPTTLASSVIMLLAGLRTAPRSGRRRSRTSF